MDYILRSAIEIFRTFFLNKATKGGTLLVTETPMLTLTPTLFKKHETVSYFKDLAMTLLVCPPASVGNVHCTLYSLLLTVY